MSRRDHEIFHAVPKTDRRNETGIIGVMFWMTVVERKTLLEVVLPLAI